MVRLALLIAMAALLAGAPTNLQAQEKEPPAEPTEAEKRAEARLHELGKVTPDFTLPLVGGGEVTLFNLLKGSKAVMVVFWGIEPQYGGDAIPKLYKLHRKLEERGLSTVVINPQDSLPEVKEFMEAQKIDFLVAIDGKETNRAVTGVYRARSLPAYYLLDRDSKVVWKGVVYREAPIVAALEKLGVK